MTDYLIRPAVLEDLPELLRIFRAAKAYMDRTGNPTQWPAGYPTEEDLRGDIDVGKHYVIEHRDTHVPFAAFVFITTPDPTYAVMKSGTWKEDTPYGTIHRVGSDGSVKGVFRMIADYAKSRCPHLRVDTHEDNKTMQHAILSQGFEYRGVIITDNGTDRLAYEYVAPKA